MRELVRLCKRHNMMAAPTFHNDVSFHDTMIVIPFDKEAEDFLGWTGIEVGK